MRREEPAGIREAVNIEIAKREEFVNFHGITAENIETFLVTPFQVPVDPDDLETPVRPMWVVLQRGQRSDPRARGRLRPGSAAALGRCRARS